MNYSLRFALLCGSAALLSACTSSLPTLVEIDANTIGSSDSHQIGKINRSPQLNLRAIAQRVQRNNLQLRAAHLRIHEARGQVVQAGRLSNPELSIDLSKTVGGSEGELELGFAQRFPITNKLALEKRISQKHLEIAQEEIKAAQRTLIAEAQLLAVDILHNRKRRAHIERQVEQLNTFSDFIDKAAQRGELSSLDANSAKVEAATLKAEISQLRNEEQRQINQLKGRIGLRHSAPLTLSGTLPAVDSNKPMLSLSKRAEYRAKRTEIELAKQQLALAKANRYQDVEGRAFSSIGREEDAPEGLETEGTIGVGVSIPLQFYDKNQGNIQTAQARLERVSAEKSALALAIQQQVANQRTAMLNWKQQSENLRSNLIPLAKENAQQLELAYRNGQAPFTTVLQARTQLLTLESKNIDQLEAFHKARVRYFAATGNAQSAF